MPCFKNETFIFLELNLFLLKECYKSSGVKGCRVIVTTSNSEVALVMHYIATYRIDELLEEECWSLFNKYAFHDGNSDAHLEWEAIGRQIIKNCKGLPLAIKTIRTLLRSKDVKEWDIVLRSELWDLSLDEIGIHPSRFGIKL